MPHNIFSNNLVVTDTSFHGCVSREFVYNPPTDTNSTRYTTRIQLVIREGDVVVGTKNDEHSRLISLNLRSPFKINSCYNSYYSILIVVT